MLHSSCSGKGEPVLLLHGLFGSGDNLSALARTLEDSFCVYRLDLPNHGRSGHSEHMSLDAMAAELLAFMDAQQLSRVRLVGHSLGGKVSMQLALCNPQRVQSLVVADIAPVDYPAHHDQVLAALHEVLARGVASRAEADGLMSNYIDEPGVRQFLLKSLYRDQQQGYRWRFNLSLIERDYAQILQAPSAGLQYRGPCLFIKGEQSDYILARHRAAIEQYFPAFSFKMIQGAGHWLHAEKPQIFNKLVKSFLLQH